LRLREGECLGLTVPRIDFMRGRIRVAEQMQNRVASPLKTEKSARIVPVEQMIIDKINGHLALWPTDGLLITNRLGGPVQRNSSATAGGPLSRRLGCRRGRGSTT
jgi:integrase